MTSTDAPDPAPRTLAALRGRYPGWEIGWAAIGGSGLLQARSTQDCHGIRTCLTAMTLEDLDRLLSEHVLATSHTTHEQRLQLCPQAVAKARAWVRSLIPPDVDADAAELCVSELTTNAYAHTRSRYGWATLRLEVGQAHVRVEVCDAGTLACAPDIGRVMPSGRAERGRGLALVARLSDDLGVDGGPFGRTVWFVLRRA